MLDSNRYANIFSGSTDNNDTFVWPYVILVRLPELNATTAYELRNKLYSSFYLMLFFDLFGILAALIFLWLSIHCLCIHIHTRRTEEEMDYTLSGGNVSSPFSGVQSIQSVEEGSRLWSYTGSGATLVNDRRCLVNFDSSSSSFLQLPHRHRRLLPLVGRWLVDAPHKLCSYAQQVLLPRFEPEVHHLARPA